jgi:subtilisin family serine protease
VVAASDQNDALASFSNYGSTTVDLAAPGVNILSTKPPGAGEGTSPSFLQVGNTSYAAIAMTFSGTTLGITGSIIDCGLGNPADFPASVNGNIALILRGTLTFSEKVTNAMAAGAHAAIVYNNASGNFFGTLQTEDAWIPSETISQADGLAIKAALPATGTVIVPPDYQYLDGTSMATPHVTGAVAFAAQNFPNETVAQRIARILTHVDVKTGLQGKVVTGGRLNLLRIVDTDGNGLPDWWEQIYFGQPTGVNPTADRDGDGMTNLQEFFAGTNPSDPQSVFRISSIVGEMNGTGFVVTWTAVSGMSYRVSYSASLAGPWLSDLPNSQITAQSGQTSLSYTDTTAGVASARFYRVQLVEP